MNDGISSQSFLALATTRTLLSSSSVLLTRLLPVSDQGSYTALQGPDDPNRPLNVCEMSRSCEEVSFQT